MIWEECLGKNVFKRAPDIEEGRSLMRMAITRLKFVDEIDKSKYPSLAVEGYYEIMKELITSLLAKEGYKSYSHECLIAFLSKFYEFTEGEIHLIDECRRIRHDIGYRGFFVDVEYLDRNEVRIRGIIGKLLAICRKELG